MNSSYSDILSRIEAAIEAVRPVFARFTPGEIETEYKAGLDPVTEADRAVDAVLRQNLLREGEGWLSEETADNPSRLDKSRVWIVDPLDGRPVAGGICNPATNETIIGAIDCGVLYNGKPVQPSQRKALKGSLILASRSEVKRGEWQQFMGGEYQIRPMGSVAYKLGLVSAGLADVTFTLTPKNEWDVAAGAALVASAGGFVSTLELTPLRCNRRNPLLTGLLSSAPFLREELLAAVQSHLPVPAASNGG